MQFLQGDPISQDDDYYDMEKIEKNMIVLDQGIKDFDFINKQVLMPINKNLQPKLPDHPSDKDFSVYESKPVYIKTVYPICKVMNSLERPKKVVFIGSDDKEYKFLLKYDK